MARLKIKSGDIAGFRYVVTQLPGTEGRRWADELGRAVLPAIIELLDTLPAVDKKEITIKKIVELINVQQAKSAVSTILAALPSHRVDALIDDLSKSTEIYGPGFGDSGAPMSVDLNGRQMNDNFNEHFAGRYKAMYQWLGFALKVNFADFFSERVGEIVTDPLTSTARA